MIEAIAAGEPVSLMGSSMGGYLASIYAGRIPKWAELVLLAPAFAISRRWPQWLGEERMAEWRAKGSLEFFHYAQNRPLPLSYRLLEDCAHTRTIRISASRRSSSTGFTTTPCRRAVRRHSRHPTRTPDWRSSIRDTNC